MEVVPPEQFPMDGSAPSNLVSFGNARVTRSGVNDDAVGSLLGKEEGR